MKFKSNLSLTCLLLIIGCAHSARNTATVTSKANQLIDSSKWRGFNFLNMFWKDWKEGPYKANDFKWLHEFGFNYARLALDYRIWTAPNDLNKFDETKLKWLDEAVDFAQKYKIHVSVLT